MITSSRYTHCPGLSNCGPFSKQEILKLCDLGLSMALQEESQQCKTFCGTLPC